jgi:hypothetical protein
MKPRGAPELVYGRDGRPLTIGIEADIDELREAVGFAGKYRLDPINDDGKGVENVPAAYIQVVKPLRNADGATPSTPATSDDTLREAMRFNTELAKSVIERFPEMMTAAAELLRAADGAGLPSRKPLVDDEVELEVQRPSGGFDLSSLFAQFVPMLIATLGSGKAKVPGLDELLDWRKAGPKARASLPDKPQKPAEAEQQLVKEAVPENATDVLPPIDPQTMAHFIACSRRSRPRNRPSRVRSPRS